MALAARSQLEQDLRAWILSALAGDHPAMQVVFSGHGGAGLTLPYVLVALVSKIEQGTLAKVISDTPAATPGNVEVTYVQRFTGLARVTVVGSTETISAWSVSSLIARSPRIVATSLALSGLNLGVSTGGLATDVSLLSETTQETRVQQDFRFSYTECTLDSATGITPIERVIATGTIDPDGDPLIVVADSNNAMP